MNIINAQINQKKNIFILENIFRLHNGNPQQRRTQDQSCWKVLLENEAEYLDTCFL